MLQTLDEYYLEIGPDSDTLILSRRACFKCKFNAHEVLTSNELAGLNWQSRSTVMVVDNYVLVSGHLSSDKKKNAINIQELRTD